MGKYSKRIHDFKDMAELNRWLDNPALSQAPAMRKNRLKIILEGTKIKDPKEYFRNKEHRENYSRNYGILQVKAHNLTRHAIYSGKIRRGKRCNRCPETKSLVAHHPDYTKPLKIEWLCRPCHAIEHGWKRQHYLPPSQRFRAKTA